MQVVSRRVLFWLIDTGLRTIWPTIRWTYGRFDRWTDQSDRRARRINATSDRSVQSDRINMVWAGSTPLFVITAGLITAFISPSECMRTHSIRRRPRLVRLHHVHLCCCCCLAGRTPHSRVFVVGKIIWAAFTFHCYQSCQSPRLLYNCNLSTRSSQNRPELTMLLDGEITKIIWRQKWVTERPYSLANIIKCTIFMTVIRLNGFQPLFIIVNNT